METLEINVADVLDLPPTFTESAYTFEVAEGAYTSVSPRMKKQQFIPWIDNFSNT